MNVKREYEKAVKKTVSMPAILLDKGHDRCRQLGFSAFSDYVQMLIRKDTIRDTEQIAA